MMTNIVRVISSGLVVLLATALAACAASGKAPQAVAGDDISRVIKLKDATTCVEPAGLAESRQAPGAVLLAELLESELKYDEALSRAKALNLGHEEIEAVYFDVCRAYSIAAIKQEAFEKSRKIYLELRQQLVAQDVRRWLEKKEGIADPGKLCLVILGDTDPERRSFTRVLPMQATAIDCAQLANKNGSNEVLLGCTRGRWENRWALKPVTLSATGAKLRGLYGKSPAHTPDPNCGWN